MICIDNNSNTVSEPNNNSNTNSNVKIDKNRIQSRNWDIMTYVSKGCLDSALDSHRDIIRGYAYIFHDKFSAVELGEKDKKVSHYHLIVRLYRPVNRTTIINWFTEYNDDGSRINTRALVMSNFQDRYDYLTHLHNPEKYQFLASDIVSYNPSCFFSKKNCNDDSAVDALNDLLAGTSVYDVCTRYGRDVIYHFPQLKFCFDLIFYGREFEEVKQKNELLNRSRTLDDVNHPFTGVEHIDYFK